MTINEFRKECSILALQAKKEAKEFSGIYCKTCCNLLKERKDRFWCGCTTWMKEIMEHYLIAGYLTRVIKR